MKFQPNSFNSVQLTERTKIAFSYVTRGIIWKKNMQELWLMCMTHRRNVLYKCMKFRWNISNGYQVIERTRFCYGETDGWMDRQIQGGDITYHITLRMAKTYRVLDILRAIGFKENICDPTTIVGMFVVILTSVWILNWTTVEVDVFEISSSHQVRHKTKTS